MKNDETTSAKCVYVLSEIDGCRYKLVMEGDVELLTTAKVKRYLKNATGLSPRYQELSFRGRTLRDDDCGGDVGLKDGALLRLRHTNATRRANSGSVDKPRGRSQSASSAGHRGGSAAVDTSLSGSPAVEMSMPPQTSHNGGSLHSSGGAVCCSGGNMTGHNRRTERDYQELERENTRLERCLVEAERRLSNASSDCRLQEEVRELRGTVMRLMKEKGSAERFAEEKWLAKEEELVRELDLLREERRRLRREQVCREQEQRALVHTLKEQICSQQKELLEREAMLEQHRKQLCCVKSTVAETVEKSLKQLSLELGILQLRLDENDSCVLPLENGTNILITFDTVTERLFMYAVIANSLPPSAEDRLELFETLLEGSLLGREMAGGGVGICSRNNLIIMNVCVDVAHADEYALVSVARPFMTSVQHWLEVVKRITSRGS